MLKKFYPLVFAFFIAGLFVGCNKKTEAVPFIVGFDVNFPPYAFQRKNGSYTGFDLDLAAEVARRNGWTLELRPVEWAAKDEELNAGAISCIWTGFSITKGRRNQYTWSEPYAWNKQVVLVRTGSGIQTLADLNGRKVVAQDGSSGVFALDSFLWEQKKNNPAFRFAKYDKVPDYDAARMLLEAEAIDAIAMDSAVANGFAEESKGGFTILDEALADEYYGVGFKRGNVELRDKVQATLKAMVADGTCQKIVSRWKNRRKFGGDGIVFILK